MIRNLKLHNFKSHKDSDFAFNNLTVLCGANGVGKSSVVQALLALRESYLDKSNASELRYLNLKTDAVNLGGVRDTLYQFGDDDLITFEISTDLQNFHFNFQADTLRNPTATIIPAAPQGHIYDHSQTDKESLFNNSCQYISAARLGPQESYRKNDAVVVIRNQISVEEGKAEFFLHFLDHNRYLDVIPALRHPDSEATDLLSQTTAWEREISKNVNIVVQDARDLGYELRYQFSTGSSGRTQEFKASNVGFGLTYAMPIIVALLSATPGSIIFIENPEAHLHPAGQSKMAALICLAAQAGIQVVIETHSDHIINGILVKIKNFENGQNGIDRKNVSLFHITRDDENHCSHAHEIKIDEGGMITYAPEGFFDQFTIDRRLLMGF